MTTDSTRNKANRAKINSIEKQFVAAHKKDFTTPKTKSKSIVAAEGTAPDITKKPALLTPDPVTEKLALVSRRETFRRDYSGITLPGVASILQSVYTGWLDQVYDWYDNMMFDPHILALTQLRMNYVSGKEMKVEPADDSPEAVMAADFVRERLEEIPHLGTVVKQLLRAVFTGMEVQEVDWTWDDELQIWKINELNSVNPKKMMYTFDTMELRLTQRYGPNALHRDFSLNEFPGKFIIHSPLVVSRYPQYSGLFYYLSFRYFYKNILLRYGLSGTERFAFPILYAKVPEQAEGLNRQDLLNDLDAFTNNATAIFDDRVALETIESSISTSSENIVLNFVKYFESEMTKVILGGTANFEAVATGLASNIAEVHKSNSINIFMEDARTICETLEAYLVRYIIQYNLHMFPGNVEPPMPKLTIDVTEPFDINQMAVDAGIVRKNELRKLFGLDAFDPKTEGGNDLIPGKYELAAAAKEQAALPAIGQTVPEDDDNSNSQIPGESPTLTGGSNELSAGLLPTEQGAPFSAATEGGKNIPSKDDVIPSGKQPTDQDHRQDKLYPDSGTSKYTIKKAGSKWEVWNEAGTKKLGTHDSKESAQRQLAAIEANK